MKTRIYIILLSFFFLFSCNMGNSPKKAAQNFLNAFNEKKFDEARKYSTPETIKLIDLMENLTKMTESTDSIVPGKIEITSERVEGDSAFVSFREEGGTEEVLKLLKVDGEWLVHITKQDISAKDTHTDNSAEEGIMLEQEPVQNDTSPKE
jgi:hypothetical protein